MDLKNENLRTLKVTSTSGKNVRDTKQLAGEASKDSLSGKNSTVEYTTSKSIGGLGKMGGLPTR